MAYKQLTVEERYQIEALKREGFNQSEIARSLSWHPSTINRELTRNSDHKGYRGKLAVSRKDRRRREAKKSEKLDSAMCSMIGNLLTDSTGAIIRMVAAEYGSFLNRKRWLLRVDARKEIEQGSR